MDRHELDRRIQVAASHIVVPRRSLRRPARGWPVSAGAIAATAAVLVGAVLVGEQLAEWRSGGVAASPTPAVSPSPSASPGPTMTPTPPPLVFTYESPMFGYQIQLPEGFRFSDCLSAWYSQGAGLGTEVLTLLSQEQERGEDRGHVARGGRMAMWTFWVYVRSADGRSALEWATERSLGQRVEPVVINGQEAARRMVDGEADLYVVRADERMYLIELFFEPSDPTPRPDVLPGGILDSVALTLRPGPAGPIPTPTPQPEVPPPGAREAAAQLAGALQAGDADRLAAIITPRCWLDTSFPEAGPLGRAVDPYLADLRKHFAGGHLRVTVEPAVQVAAKAGPGGLRLFVRSDWTESGRTTRIDLFFREIDGRWYWGGARYLDHPPAP